jgi:phosphoglycolate phosphatase-like HAD superfamily hydrolase
VPAKTLFVGDARFDIECGHSAGIDTALVTWSHNKADQMTVKPTFVIDSMLDLYG